MRQCYMSCMLTETTSRALCLVRPPTAIATGSTWKVQQAVPSSPRRRFNTGLGSTEDQTSLIRTSGRNLKHVDVVAPHMQGSAARDLQHRSWDLWVKRHHQGVENQRQSPKTTRRKTTHLARRRVPDLKLSAVGRGRNLQVRSKALTSYLRYVQLDIEEILC
jgi:hypothetical protein